MFIDISFWSNFVTFTFSAKVRLKNCNVICFTLSEVSGKINTSIWKLNKNKNMTICWKIYFEGKINIRECYIIKESNCILNVINKSKWFAKYCCKQILDWKCKPGFFFKVKNYQSMKILILKNVDSSVCNLVNML